MGVADPDSGGRIDVGGAGAAGAEAAAAPSEPCDVCGAAMYDFHCRLVCPNCGYQRDCSDP